MPATAEQPFLLAADRAEKRAPEKCASPLKTRVGVLRVSRTNRTRKTRAQLAPSRRVAPLAATKPASDACETGFVYYGSRYYSPSQGRFLGRDTIDEEGGLNLYAFCGNDAVNFWDALGNIAMGPGTDPDEFMRQAAAMFQGLQGSWQGFSFDYDGNTPFLVTTNGGRYEMLQGGADVAFDVRFKLGDTIYTSVEAGTNNVIGYVTNTGQTNVNLGTVVRGLSGNPVARPLHEVLASQDISLGAMQSDYANRISVSSLLFSNRYTTAPMSLVDYQWVAMSLYQSAAYALVPGQQAWNQFIASGYTDTSAGMSAGAQMVAGIALAALGGAIPQQVVTTPTMTSGFVSNIVGQSFGKLGVVVPKPLLTVTGYTTHGLDAAMARNMSQRMIESIVAQPTVVLRQSAGQYLYLSPTGGVVLNPAGQVMTTYRASSFGPGVRAALQAAGGG